MKAVIKPVHSNGAPVPGRVYKHKTAGNFWLGMDSDYLILLNGEGAFRETYLTKEYHGWYKNFDEVGDLEVTE